MGLIAFQKSGGAQRGAAKYVVVQAVGSSLVVYSLFLQGVTSGRGGILMVGAGGLLLKLGVAPAHSWFISFIRELR